MEDSLQIKTEVESETATTHRIAVSFLVAVSVISLASILTAVVMSLLSPS